MNLQHIRVIARYELGQSLLSTRGILFLVTYGIVWFWLLWKLTSGWASNLADQQGQVVASWLLDPTLARVLFLDHPPTLGLFFLILMSLIPVFTMWGAGDQTATDIGTRHLRFLIHLCGRSEIYLGRFLGALILMLVLHVIVVAAGMCVSVLAYSADGVLPWGMQVMLVSILYTIPYVALMSLFGAVMGSAAGAILSAIAAYASFLMAAGFLSLKWPAAAYIGYLFPVPLKPLLLTGHGAAFMVALLSLLAYSACYFLAGWALFLRRDI